MQKVDVFLDRIGFSDFNTAILAIECRLPIVTSRFAIFDDLTPIRVLEQFLIDRVQNIEIAQIS